MARLDYYAILAAVKTALEANAALAGVAVVIEEELIFGAETCPWIGIYLMRRDAPADLQPLRAGQVTRYLVRLAIWCWEYSLESLPIAARMRDDLVGKVETALMADRTLGGLVHKSWLEGGDMPSQKDEGSWLCGGEVILVCDAQATTT